MGPKGTFPIERKGNHEQRLPRENLNDIQASLGRQKLASSGRRDFKGTMNAQGIGEAERGGRRIGHNNLPHRKCGICR